jgi:hypothetical protein
MHAWSSRGLLRGPRKSSFLHSYSEPRLQSVFQAVRQFVSRSCPEVAHVALKFDCKELIHFRKTHPGYLGERALMHVGCGAGMVCSIRWAAGLSDSNLAALFLHEFGHLAGGESEPSANGWVEKVFGIRIEYRGPLDLEWIPPVVARRILASYSSSPSS